MATKIRNVLLSELEIRKQRNAYYSLRAFSRDLGIGLGSLSEVLSGKRELSPKNLKQVLNVLNLKSDLIKPQKKELTEEESHQLMIEDQFRLIADWYFIAILNLAKLKNNKASSHWISERLGIEIYQAQEAIDRLTRLGLLKIEKNKLVRTIKPITTSQDLPSVAIKKHHLQNLLLAEKALNQIEVSQREFGSVTMIVDMKNLPKVKDLLLKTRKKAAQLLEKGNPTQVYTLSFQLFPVSRSERK